MDSPHRILRHALGRAGIVDSWLHVCRRCASSGEELVERRTDSAPRNCPKCKMKLWPKPIPITRPLRFHDLRHSAATILLRAGVDIHRVQRILRHASVTTTSGTYAHLAVEDLREALGHMEGIHQAIEVPAALAASGNVPAVRVGPENRPSEGLAKPLMSQSIFRCAKQESNLRPSGSKPDALSS